MLRLLRPAVLVEIFHGGAQESIVADWLKASPNGSDVQTKYFVSNASTEIDFLLD